MKVIIEKALSKNNNHEYVRAIIDLDYKKKIIAIGDYECAELAGMLPQAMHDKLKGGNKIIL